AYTSGNYRKVIVALSGFSNSGAGKLVGPDGQEIDSETFLSDLKILGVTTNTTTSANVLNPYLFRVVTQKYGKGMVQYGGSSSTSWPSTGNGGSYDDICTANGFIFLEVDLQVPTCINCGAESLDGYTGSTFSSST
ncbi:MAG: hypothetical protein ACK559_37235, partial [bacterium]